MEYQVLYETEPAWLVGETTAEREERLNAGTPCITDDCYRGNYGGRVTSIRAVRDVIQGRFPSLQNMSDKDHPMVVLDLDEDGRADVASRRLKIVDGKSEPVTFDDRWGAIAQVLHAQFEDPEATELKADDPFDVEGRRFVEVSRTAVDLLPPTVTSTGTGLYSTKVTPTKNDDTQSGAPAGQVITLVTGGLGTADAFKGGYVLNVTETETRAIVSHTDGTITLEGDLTNWTNTDDLDIFDAWSTVQAAWDQLFTDQGATEFTALQYVRGFAGSYDENVVPNPALVTSDADGWLVVFEGDPLDDRANIAIAPASGLGIDVGIAAILIRNLTFTGASNDEAIDIGNASTWAYISNCVIIGGDTKKAVISRADSTTIEDCVITSGDIAITISVSEQGVVRRCSITNPVGGINEGIWLRKSPGVIEGCTISGYAVGVKASDDLAYAELRNNTFYDCDDAFTHESGSRPGAEFINNIFISCPNILLLSAFGDEASGTIAAPIILTHNVFYDYTTVAENRLAATATFAQFAAFDLVRASGNLDAVSPLLTDPGNGDFSLSSGSPCIWTGHGSGVLEGINSVAFDPYHPDIGAWSSGVLPASTLNISSISPNGDADSFDMTVANTLGMTVNVYTSPNIPASFSLESTTRVGDGDLTITGKIDGTLYYVYAVTLIGNTIAGVSNIVKVLITDADTGGIPDDLDEDTSILPGVDLLLRDDTHDLAVADRDLVLVDGSALVKQRLSVILQLFKSEWFLDANAGIPYFQEILKKGVDATVIDAIFRTAIIATDGVNRILTYTPAVIDAAARTVSVAFTVDTVYGPVEFEETLV